MSRTRRMRMRQIRRNRRIAFVLGILLTAILFSVLFNQLHVMAERPQTYKYYTQVRVERNDTLWSIAEEYMTEEYISVNQYVREVQKINGIGPIVEYGQYLMVPYYSEEVK